MKFIKASDSEWFLPTIELTRRNLEVLLAKLDDPLSLKTITRGGYAVSAVEEDGREGGHIDDQPAMQADGHIVQAVENEAHYSDRDPGRMYMPSSGQKI